MDSMRWKRRTTIAGSMVLMAMLLGASCPERSPASDRVELTRTEVLVRIGKWFDTEAEADKFCEGLLRQQAERQGADFTPAFRGYGACSVLYKTEPVWTVVHYGPRPRTWSDHVYIGSFGHEVLHGLGATHRPWK